MDDKIASQLETLTGLMSSLKSAVGDLNGAIKGLNSSANNMSSAISEAEKSAGSFNKALGGSQSAMKEFADGLNQSLEKAESFNTSMDQKALAATKHIHRRYGAFFSKHEKESISHQKRFLGKFRDYANEQYEIFHSLESRRAKIFFALEGAFNIFKTLLGFGNSLFKIFKDVGGVVLNTAKFIITLPLKTLETMLDIAHSIREEFLAISQTFEDTQENISGTSRQGMGLASLTSEVRGLGGAFLNVGSEAARTFGYALQGQQAMISKTAEKINGLSTLGNLYGSSYANNAILVERAMQSLGMSVEDNAILVRQSMSEGIHPFQALTRSINASKEASSKFGIDQKQVAKGMNELRKNIVEFSHISEPELAGVVAQAAQLGIEAKELNAVFSKFTTFDQAAESAALLSQTFGMAVDAMDIIRAEDPMEIINQFREGMQQTGRDFRDLNRHEKALLSQYTGLSGEALQTAMSFEGIGLSYEELQKKMEENSPQAQLKDAVKEMSASIKEFMNVGKKLTSPFQAITEGMKDALVKNSRFQRSMMGLSNSIQRLYSGVLSRFINRGLLDSIDNIVKQFARLIDKDVIDGFVTLAQKFASFLSVILDSKSDYLAISASFDDMLQTFLKNPFVDRLFDLGKVMIGNIASGFIKALPTILRGFVDLLKMFNGTLKSTDLSDSRSGLGSWFQKYILTAWSQVRGLITGEEGLLAQLFSELKAGIGNSTGVLYEIGKAIGSILLGAIKGAWEEYEWGPVGITIASILGAPLVAKLTSMVGAGLERVMPKTNNARMNDALSGGIGNNTPSKTPQAPKSGGGFLGKLKGFGRGALKLGGAALGSVGTAFSAYNAYDDFSRGNTAGGVLNTIATGAGAVALAGLAGVFSPVVAGIAATTATVAGVSALFTSASEEAKADRASSKREVEQSRKVSEAVAKQASQPIVINLSIKQSLDGDELTNRILSAAINGTTQFNINTDDAGRMQLLSKNANDAGGYNPVPQA